MIFDDSLPIFSVIERVKNYARECAEIQNDYFDGAHMSNFVLQCCTDFESLFSNSIENYDLTFHAGCFAREALKGKVDLHKLYLSVV